MKTRKTVEEAILADAPPFWNLLHDGLIALIFIVSFGSTVLLMLHYHKNPTLLVCISIPALFVVTAMLYFGGSALINSARRNRWVKNNMSNSHYLPLEQAQAKILRCEIETREDDYGAIWTMYWAFFEFVADRDLVPLKARVSRSFFEQTEPGMVLGVRYNAANPHIALLEGEKGYDKLD